VFVVNLSVSAETSIVNIISLRRGLSMSDSPPFILHSHELAHHQNVRQKLGDLGGRYVHTNEMRQARRWSNQR
jgi:hypothetical protein